MYLSDNSLSEALPLSDLLQNSLFYPSCGFDGGVIKDCNTLRQHLGITSFIYCDYGVRKVDFLRKQNSFAGYEIIGSRNLVISDLIPNGWTPQIPPGLTRDTYMRFVSKDLETFAIWSVYKRLPKRDPKYGPEFFSLLYICGDGAATYQALYTANKSCPKALAIIQPGTSFGGNWSDFEDENGAFSWVVKSNSAGMPKTVYRGGYGVNYPENFWKDYVHIATINDYYQEKLTRKVGTVQVFELK